MNRDLDLVIGLRKALRSVSEGRGLSSSLVRELSRLESGRKVASFILMGHPPRKAVAGLGADSAEIRMLADLVAVSTLTSTEGVGRKGVSLSYLFEKWLKERENRRMELGVSAFRGSIASGVMGGVTAMVASFGPILGLLSPAGSGTSSIGILAAAFAMTALSSATLGAHFSRRRMLVNMVISSGTFLVATLVAAPLVPSNLPQVWAVK